MRQARTRQSRAKRTSATAWFLIRAVAEWVGEAAVAAGLLAAPRLGEDFRAAPQTGRPLGLRRAGRRPWGRGWRADLVRSWFRVHGRCTRWWNPAARATPARCSF